MKRGLVDDRGLFSVGGGLREILIRHKLGSGTFADMKYIYFLITTRFLGSIRASWYGLTDQERAVKIIPLIYCNAFGKGQLAMFALPTIQCIYSTKNIYKAGGGRREAKQTAPLPQQNYIETNTH